MNIKQLIIYIAKDKLIIILFITDTGNIQDYLLIIHSSFTLISVINIKSDTFCVKWLPKFVNISNQNLNTIAIN